MYGRHSTTLASIGATGISYAGSRFAGLMPLWQAFVMAAAVVTTVTAFRIGRRIQLRSRERRVAS
jgi:hypothetical protein